MQPFLLLYIQRSLSTTSKSDDSSPPNIHNMVAVGDCHFPIRLEGLSIDHIDATTVVLLLSTYFQYEPELFSGLIYHMKNPKVGLFIFVSGKVVVTGAKVVFQNGIDFQTTDQIKEAFEKITPLIYECKKRQCVCSTNSRLICVDD